MKRSRLIVFVLLVMAQVVFVGNMVRSSEAVLTSGQRVTLQTRPIDPRDLFRGDYVILDYAIEAIPRLGVPWEMENPSEGDRIWVVLEPRGEFSEPTAVLGSPAAGDAVAIRGTITWVRDDEVGVDYDINEYFVPEGRGWEVERAQRVDVVVAVDDDGAAVIDHLIVDGWRWDPEG